MCLGKWCQWSDGVLIWSWKDVEHLVEMNIGERVAEGLKRVGGMVNFLKEMISVLAYAENLKRLEIIIFMYNEVYALKIVVI